ncbi:hypothetical protein SUGI_0031290 [Cryptomeria japonica]|nr:hypothetical protein SUGI_0031290 [Cryptomeria japonica]
MVLLFFQLSDSGVLGISSDINNNIQNLNKELLQNQKLSQFLDYGDVDPSPVPSTAMPGPTPHAETETSGLEEVD